MYVCICRGFNERQVRNAAQDSCSVSGIFRTLGGRPSCGKCVSVVREIAEDVAREPRRALPAREVPEPVAG